MIFRFQRKLRAFEKKPDPTQKSMDDPADAEIQLQMQKPACSDDESIQTTSILTAESTETKSTPQVRIPLTQLITAEYIN